MHCCDCFSYTVTISLERLPFLWCPMSILIKMWMYSYGFEKGILSRLYCQVSFIFGCFLAFIWIPCYVSEKVWLIFNAFKNGILLSYIVSFQSFFWIMLCHLVYPMLLLMEICDLYLWCFSTRIFCGFELCLFGYWHVVKIDYNPMNEFSWYEL